MVPNLFIVQAILRKLQQKQKTVHNYCEQNLKSQFCKLPYDHTIFRDLRVNQQPISKLEK